MQECAESDVDRVVELLHATTAGCGESNSVRLVTTLAVPADEVVFALFEAPSAESVAVECERVGLPPVRVNVALHSAPGQPSGSRVLG